MPRIQKMFELDITPERFLEACSVSELIEVDLLIQSARFRAKITSDKRQQKLFQPEQHEPNHPQAN